MHGLPSTKCVLTTSVQLNTLAVGRLGKVHNVTIDRDLFNAANKVLRTCYTISTGNETVWKTTDIDVTGIDVQWLSFEIRAASRKYKFCLRYLNISTLTV